ncbi:MAG: bacteriohemerythrin [Desulfamplus sp.]|nr:bacteriohemerythrin [Desulfamplus sp.]
MKGKTIQWRDEFSTGNDILDIQHKELITRISKLLEEAELLNTAAISGTIDFLFDYVYSHFVLEEKMMIQTGYPDFEVHLEQHTYYVKYINNLKKTRLITRELISEMQSVLLVWFLEHIIMEDRKMAEHLREYCHNGYSSN